VGASGDLTPLSYVSAVVMGEREVFWRGQIRPAAAALAEAGLAPLPLLPKESLAIMNGTSMMTGLACLVFARARNLARFAAWLSAAACAALEGNPSHFDARLFAAKPHPGQAACARWIREDLGVGERPAPGPHRLQDRYSLRCAPHVIGVLLDALAAFRPWIETELNSANDNPIVDATTDEVVHGGNFYGGHMAFALDGLKAAVANVADLLDRQMALLCNPATNHGLPADLVGHRGDECSAHHGFKAMQITASALTAEALKLSVPASVFSRSTESHNQDKVSMGSIAARDAQRILDLTETVGAIALLALCQALDLRAAGTGQILVATPAPGDAGAWPPSLEVVHAAVRATIPYNDADRRQDEDIANVLASYRSGALPFAAPDFG
jgi:histidine ammonia-lyase